MEQKEQELSEKIANATLEQLRIKFQADMEILAKLAPSPENDAIEASLDCKWLKDRQMNHVHQIGNPFLCKAAYSPFSTFSFQNNCLFVA